MPLSDTQKQQLADFAGLREENGSYRSATTEELAATPSPLRDLRDAKRLRITSAASFLNSVNRVETTASRHTLARTASGTLSLLEGILETAGS